MFSPVPQSIIMNPYQGEAGTEHLRRYTGQTKRPALGVQSGPRDQEMISEVFYDLDGQEVVVEFVVDDRKVKLAKRD